MEKELLYCTQDPIGQVSHGGGTLAQNEVDALSTLGHVDVINPSFTNDAFSGDEIAVANLPDKKYELAHFYSQTYSKTIAELKKRGTKVTYTCPAHDVKISKEEHEAMGLNFDYPHLTDPELWRRYHQGYKDCDVLIAQSNYSKRVLRDQGCEQRIEVVAPGCRFPEEKIAPANHFAVGFLGNCGPDKGLKYLIEAWSNLNYKDSQLVLAGRNIEGYRNLIRQGKGSYYLQGGVEDIADFFKLISVYVQFSCTESYGLEITEAMAYGRAVISSDCAGGCDAVIPNVNGFIVPRRDVATLSKIIDYYKENSETAINHGAIGKQIAKKYTWERCKNQLISIWKGMLDGN